MTVSRFLSVVMIIVVAAACDSDGTGPLPTGLAYAGATYECVGPLSESGVAIYLATEPVQSLTPKPSPPYVRIIIRRSLADLTDQPWVVAGGGAQATAWHHSNATVQDIATSGSVTINSVTADNTIDGWADLTFPGAGRVGGNFRAFWLAPTQLCV